MISCILLAAGLSSRFGSPKPLARLDSETVIERLQRALLKTKVSEIIIVLGAEADKILPYLSSQPRLKHVINTRYALGQTSSFKTGLSVLNPQTQGIMLLPVDVPAVKTQTLDFLIDTFMKEHPAILIPTYGGRGGHPPIFSASLLHELENLKDDEPLSKIQRVHETEVLRIPVDDEGILLSFNTPQELQNITEKLPPLLFPSTPLKSSPA